MQQRTIVLSHTRVAVDCDDFRSPFCLFLSGAVKRGTFRRAAGHGRTRKIWRQSTFFFVADSVNAWEIFNII